MLKMERACRLMQTARLCEDGEAYEEAEAGYEHARAVYEGWRARAGAADRGAAMKEFRNEQQR